MRHAHTSRHVSRSVTESREQVVILSSEAFAQLRKAATVGAKAIYESDPAISDVDMQILLMTLVGIGCDTSQLWSGAGDEADRLFAEERRESPVEETA